MPPNGASRVSNSDVPGSSSDPLTDSVAHPLQIDDVRASVASHCRLPLGLTSDLAAVRSSVSHNEFLGLIGENLFTALLPFLSSLCGRVVGMLLETDIDHELLPLLLDAERTSELLSNRVEEALHALSDFATSRWADAPEEDDELPPLPLLPSRTGHLSRGAPPLNRPAHVHPSGTLSNAAPLSGFEVLRSSGGSDVDPHGPLSDSDAAVRLQRFARGRLARQLRLPRLLLIIKAILHSEAKRVPTFRTRVMFLAWRAFVLLKFSFSRRDAAYSIQRYFRGHRSRHLSGLQLLRDAGVRVAMHAEVSGPSRRLRVVNFSRPSPGYFDMVRIADASLSAARLLPSVLPCLRRELFRVYPQYRALCRRRRRLYAFSLISIHLRRYASRLRDRWPPPPLGFPASSPPWLPPHLLLPSGDRTATLIQARYRGFAVRLLQYFVHSVVSEQVRGFHFSPSDSITVPLLSRVVRSVAHLLSPRFTLGALHRPIAFLDDARPLRRGPPMVECGVCGELILICPLCGGELCGSTAHDPSPPHGSSSGPRIQASYTLHILQSGHPSFLLCNCSAHHQATVAHLSRLYVRDGRERWLRAVQLFRADNAPLCLPCTNHPVYHTASSPPGPALTPLPSPVPLSWGSFEGADFASDALLNFNVARLAPGDGWHVLISEGRACYERAMRVCRLAAHFITRRTYGGHFFTIGTTLLELVADLQSLPAPPLPPPTPTPSSRAGTSAVRCLFPPPASPPPPPTPGADALAARCLLVDGSPDSVFFHRRLSLAANGTDILAFRPFALLTRMVENQFLCHHRNYRLLRSHLLRHNLRLLRGCLLAVRWSRRVLARFYAPGGHGMLLASRDFAAGAAALSTGAADTFPPAAYRSIAGRRQVFGVTSRSLRCWRLLIYFYRSRRRSVPFKDHRLLFSPSRGHNPQSILVLQRLLDFHSRSPSRPFPPGAFYRPVPLKTCGYGSVPLATAADFATHHAFASNEVIGWYDGIGPALLALAMDCTRLSAAFGFSDCNGFGSLLPSSSSVPVDAHLIDLTVHPAARAFFGDSSCHDGDALDFDLRSSLCRIPGFVANHDSPECDSYSSAGLLSRKHVRSPQQIGAARVVLSRLFDLFGTPYSIEMVRSAKHIHASLACRLRGIDFGLPTADPHWIETPAGYRLFCDYALTRVGDSLLARSCTGAQNSLPSLDCFGAPFKVPCCGGNITSFHGSTAVCSCDLGARRLGIHPALVPSWGHLVNCTPPAFGLFVHAQLCCLILSHRCHVPFVTYDSSRSCPSLACFAAAARMVLSSQPREGPRSLPELRPLWPRFDVATLVVLPFQSSGRDPLRRVVLCTSPSSLRCETLATYPYHLPAVRLNPGEPLLESVCSCFLETYGLEAASFRPYLASISPSTLHFCISLPLSDDVMSFLCSLGCDPFAPSPVAKPPPLPPFLTGAQTLRLISRDALAASSDIPALISPCDASTIFTVANSCEQCALAPAATLTSQLRSELVSLAHLHSGVQQLDGRCDTSSTMVRTPLRTALLRHVRLHVRPRLIPAPTPVTSRCLVPYGSSPGGLRSSSKRCSPLLPDGLADLSDDALYGPRFARSPAGSIFHLDEDGVFRSVDEWSFDRRPGSVEALLARGSDARSTPAERRCALRAAAAVCAADDSFVATSANAYWFDAVSRELSSTIASPPAPATCAFSSTAPTPTGPAAVVDCLDRLFGPARLTDVQVRSGSKTASFAANCPDSGGSMTFLGFATADLLFNEFPDCITLVDRAQIAHRIRDDRLSGIGGTCLIVGHANLTIYISDRPYSIKNVAIVQHFDGFIIGNDFHAATGAAIDFKTSSVCYDHPSGRFCSPFTTVRRPLPSPLEVASPEPGAVASHIPSRVLLSEPLASAIRPLAFAPKDIVVPPRCLEKVIRVQVPSSMPVGSVVILDRVRDGVHPDKLNILVSAAAAVVGEDRTVPLTVLNPNNFPVRIPELSALAEFEHWDPSTATPPEFDVDEIMSKVNIGPEVAADPSRLGMVRDMLEKFRSCFRSTPGYTHAVRHTISTPSLLPPHGTGTIAPPRARIRTENDEQRAALRKLIDKRVQSQLVTPSRSPFCSRPMLVRKQDGTYRLVVDLRALNGVTVKDHYPLPNIIDNLSKCRGHWFTTLDLLSGFDQVELDETSKEKTAFGTSFGLFQFERMTQGLTGAPATFQRLVDKVLVGLPSSLVLSYIDDLVTKTASLDFAEHIDDITIVLTRLLQAGLTIKAEKMYIGFGRVAYLGYEIGRDGIRPDPARASAILDMPVHVIQSSAKSAATFLGMCGYYRNSIPHFSEICSPLYELSQKGCNHRSVLGSLRFLSSIHVLKHSLSGAILTRVPDFSKPFFISVDAATLHGCGAVLYQKDDDGTEGLIAAYSHRFTFEELGWNTHELEAYGLNLAVVKHFDVYVSNSHTTAFVDHAALQWLLRSNKELHNKKVREWVERLQAYDLDIIHRPGRDHRVPDAISRILLSVPPLHAPGSFDTWPASALPCLPSGEDCGGTGAAVPAAFPAFPPATCIPPSSRLSRRQSKAAEAASVPIGQPSLPTDFLQRQLLPKPPPNKNKARTRAALVLTDRSNILCLRIADAWHIPGSKVPEHLSRRPRAVATDCFRGFFGQPAARLDALIQTPAVRYGRGDTMYFIVVVPTAFPPVLDELPSSSPLTSFSLGNVNAEWVPISGEDPGFLHKDDSAFFAQALRALSSSGRAAQQLAKVFGPRAVSLVASVAPPSNQDSDLPALQCFDPFFVGPSYHALEEVAFATLAFLTRILGQPGNPRIIALDLEGHLALHGSIELLQICVSSTPSSDDPSPSDYTHVFDIRKVPTLLTRLDSNLRIWLADATIIKLVHCGRGDGLTLFGKYGVNPKGFFDTGVADALVVGRHPFSARGLGPVLRSYVSDLRLDHKGSFEHNYDTWTKRPITIRLFEYAYQDVCNCIPLYHSLLSRMAAICPANPSCLADLTLAITASSLPPFSLPADHPSAAYPPGCVFVVHDGQFCLVLRSSSRSRPHLPTFTLDTSSMQGPVVLGLALRYRRLASAAWSSFFGAPTKTGKFSTSLHRMRKPLLLPDAFVYEVEVPRLRAVIKGLDSGLPASFPSDVSFDLFPMDPVFDDIASALSPPHTYCLQYLLHLRSFSGRARATPAPSLLCTPLSPPSSFLSAVPASLSYRGAYLLLHDGVYCLLLRTKAWTKGASLHSFSFPFSRALNGELDPRLTAFHGLETMLGPLSRYSAYFGHSIRTSTLRGRLLDSPPDTPIYECRLDRAVFPFEDHISSFTVAWRNRRLTNTLTSSVLDWRVVRLSEAASQLPLPLQASVASVLQPPENPPVPLFSDCTLHLLILTDSFSGPTFILPPLSDGSANLNGFSCSAPNTFPFAIHLLAALGRQLPTSAAVDMGTRHILAARPDGAVGYEESACHRVWCIHLNVLAARSVHCAEGDRPFCHLRLSDFLSHSRLTDRPLYLGCCEVAVNNAIRTAYPRIVPTIPLLPPRSARGDPPASDVHKAPPCLDNPIPAVTLPTSGNTFFTSPSSSPAGANPDLPPGADVHKAPPPTLPPLGVGVHKAPPSASAPLPSSAYQSFYPLPSALVSHATTSTTDNGSASGVLARSIFDVLVSRCPESDVSASRLASSDGKFCRSVFIAISAFCRTGSPSPPIARAFSSTADNAIDDDDDAPPEEGGTTADSGVNQPGQFGAHKAFHTRRRRAASGTDFLPRPPTLDEIITEQRNCDEYHHVYAYLQDGPAYLLASGGDDRAALDAAMRKVSHGHRLVDGVLVFLDSSSDPTGPFRIVLPPSFRSWALHAYHDLHGHQGHKRTVGLISRLYYWPLLSADVASHLRSCDVCLRSKVSRVTAGAFHLSGDGDYPWDVVTIDLYTVGFNDDGYDHALVFADQFTRGVVAVAVKGTPSSKEVFDLYFFYVARYKGFARRIRTDRGSIFISRIIAAAYAALRIQLEASTAAHHETVGLAERFNSVLRSLLLTHRVSTADPRWSRYLPHLEIAYNAAVHSVTGFSPFYVEQGRDFPLSLDVAYHGLDSSPADVHPYVAAFVDRLHACWRLVRHRLLTRALSSKRTRDAKHDTALSFLPQQRVLVVKEKGGTFGGSATTKWHEPTHGPYRVEEVLENDNYKLSGLPSRRFHDTFHVSRLVPFPLVADGDEIPAGEYAVDRIVDRRILPGRSPSELSSYEFLVRWLGYGVDDDTWENVNNLSNAMIAVNAYNQQFPIPLDQLAEEPDDLDTSAFSAPLPPPSEWRSRRPHPEPLPSAIEAPSNDASPSPSVALEPALSSPALTGDPPALDYARPAIELDHDNSISAILPTSSDEPLPLEWLCTSCNRHNFGGSFCAHCNHSRSLFGAELTDTRPSRPAPLVTTRKLSNAQLLRTYTRPFRHPHGPARHRVNPAHKDNPKSKPRAVVEFELLRSKEWRWVWPGPNGERLTIDELNRVRAYRIDHPDAHPQST